MGHLFLIIGFVAGVLFSAPKAIEAPNSLATVKEPLPASNRNIGNPANVELQINESGIDIIQQAEGLRLEAYNNGRGWLIGYGHATTAHEGMIITVEEADALLLSDLRDFEEGVRELVMAPVNANQFSAMVSLAYNLGVNGFSRTAVLERVNARDYAGAADAFLWYDHARVDGELKSIPHLSERRQKERTLFVS